MRVNDVLFGALIALLGIGALWYARGLPDVPGHFYGPSLFPSIIGWGFVASGALLAGAALRRGGAFSGLIAFPDWRGSPRGLLQVALMVAAILVFIRFGDWLGFRLFAVATLASMYLAAGRGLLQSGAIALIVTLVLHFLFVNLLSVPLPAGVLADFLH